MIAIVTQKLHNLEEYKTPYHHLPEEFCFKKSENYHKNI